MPRLLSACDVHRHGPMLGSLAGITQGTRIHTCRPLCPALPRHTVNRCRCQLQHLAALPFAQAWGSSPDLTSESLQANIFASSIVPYSAFLYFLQKSGKAPKLTMFGFYFLLVFVGATIPAGIWGALPIQLV